MTSVGRHRPRRDVFIREEMSQLFSGDDRVTGWQPNSWTTATLANDRFLSIVKPIAVD